MALPTFIIAGAPKCGTTALWAYLNEHPEVFMTKIKEPRFFSQRYREVSANFITPGPEKSANYNKGIKWYESLFEPGIHKKARGEASTHYFYASDSAVLIKKDLPDVRLIFVLRDPVERLYSHYWQDSKAGINLPCFDYIVDRNNPYLEYYIYVSSYKIHIERYLKEFPRNQILILFLSDFRNNPVETFIKVCSFLDIDSSFIPNVLGIQYNPHRITKSRVLGRVNAFLAHNKITNKWPRYIRAPLGTVKKFISKLNSRGSTYRPLEKHIRQQLVQIFDGDIKFVESLSGRKLDEWHA